jgi:hypothetical protein
MALALDDAGFSLASYQQHERHIPAIDGYRAAKLDLRFAAAEVSTELASTTWSSSKLDAWESL